MKKLSAAELLHHKCFCGFSVLLNKLLTQRYQVMNHTEMALVFSPVNGTPLLFRYNVESFYSIQFEGLMLKICLHINLSNLN